jgi:hypothetical protein
MLRRLDETGVDMLGWKTFLAGAVVAMATVGGSALAHEGARTARSCPNLTVNAGKYGGKKTLRLVAIGVSCTKGRHLAEAFYRKAAGGGCKSHGVHCDLSFPGRWNCGFFFATETKETGGAISGCFHTRREKIRLYPTKGRRPSSFMSPDRKVWCGIGTEGASCGTYPEPPTRSGEVNAGGQVRICTALQLEYPNGAHVPRGCYQNWPTPEEKTPVLSVGQQTEVDGFRCTSATNGITCVTVAGAGAGKGFRVSTTEAVEVG